MSQQKKISQAFLYFSAMSINISAMVMGIVLSWSSPSIPKLTDQNPAENPLGRPATQYEVSLIVSLLAIGTMVGPFFAPLMDRIGRKKSVLISSIAFIVCFLLTAFANTVWIFCAARLLSGIVNSWLLIVLPNYLTEISEKHNRGILSCYIKVNITFGIFFIYCIGSYMSFFYSSLVCLIPCVLNIVFVGIFVPESPYFLVAKGQLKQAEEALITLRRNQHVLEELKEITLNVEKSFAEKTNAFKLLTNPAILKTVFIGLGLFFFQQFCALHAILYYLHTIFEAAGSQISPEASAIVVALIQFLSSILSPLLVDRLGRRYLLVISAIGVGVSITILGIYFYLKTNNYPTETIFWLPITCLISFIMFYAMGLGPLPITMSGELYPQNFKAFACSLAIVWMGFCSFLVTMGFPFVVEYVGMGESFWIFGGFCLLCLGFAYFCVPETKNKSVLEIQKMLKLYQENGVV